MVYFFCFFFISLSFFSFSSSDFLVCVFPKSQFSKIIHIFQNSLFLWIFFENPKSYWCFKKMFRFFKKFRNLKFVHVFQEVWSFKILFMVSKYCLWFQSLFMFSEMFRVSNFYSCFQKYSYFFYSPFLKFVRMFKKCVKILRKIHVEQIVPIFQSINNFEFFSHFQKMAKYKKIHISLKLFAILLFFRIFLDVQS